MSVLGSEVAEHVRETKVFEQERGVTLGHSSTIEGFLGQGKLMSRRQHNQ